jgi:hypothetical protein
MARSSPGEDMADDAAAIVAALNRHGVRYVVIGAYAAIAQQAPIPATRDIDVTPESSRANLVRLSKALKELGARVRTESEPKGLPFDHTAASLGAAVCWNLICPFGEFDVTLRPAGFDDPYAELSERAVVVRVGKVEVPVAHIDDVIRSKEAAGRPKDLQVLPVLYRWRATRAGGGQG